MSPRPFQARVGRGAALDVKLQVTEKSGTAGAVGTRRERSHCFDAFIQIDALHNHLARKQATVRSPGKPQGTTEQPTHALRITDTNAVGLRGDIVAQRPFRIVGGPRESDQAAAGFSRDIVEKEPVSVEDQVALHVAESRWKIRGTHRTVRQFHAANDARAVERALIGSVYVRVPADVRILNKPVEKPQVHRTIHPQGHGAAAGKLNRAGHLRIRVRAFHSHADDFQAVARRGQVNWTLVFELHTAICKSDMRKVSVHGERFWILEFSFQGDVAIGDAMSGEFLQMQCGKQIRIQVQIVNGYLSVHGQWISEPQSDSSGDGPLAHRRAKLELRHLSVRVQVAFKTSDVLGSKMEVHDAERAIGKGSANRSARFQAEGKLAVNRKARSFHPAEI